MADDNEAEAQVLQSGTYTPHTHKTVISWPEGSSPPEGFDIPYGRDVENRDYVVQEDERGNPVRDSYGNAASLREGGALVIHHGDNDRYETLEPEDVAAFLATHQGSDLDDVPEQETRENTSRRRRGRR